jgi:hypothetical protein
MDPTTDPAARPESMPGFLRFLLILEALGLLGVTIVLSMQASQPGVDETTIRFAAAGAFVLAILAASASRGVRRRRGWGWTLAALIQVLIAVGTAIAILVGEWQPALLIGFVAPAFVMLVLSSASVREALGQA